MRIVQLRNKILLRAISIGFVVALATMLAASLAIRQQHMEQSYNLLRQTSGIVRASLAHRGEDLLEAAHQLAAQKNLGSTIWYLGQYAQSRFERETLFNTYQQLVKDTARAARAAELYRVAIYDSAGRLVSFASFAGGREVAGYVERFRAPVFRIAVLKEGEEPNRNNLRTANSVAGMEFSFGEYLPPQETVRYAVVDGRLAIESLVPVMGEAFDPASGKVEIKQLGLVAMVQMLDQAFVEHIPRLNGIKINVFTRQGFSSGDMADYRAPDWSSLPPEFAGTNPPEMFNETSVGNTGFYQDLLPLYADRHIVGAVAVLYSKSIAEKGTWEVIRILGMIAASSLVFIIPFSWYFASTIAQPLTMLSRVFRGVASGRQPVNLQGDLLQLEKAKARGDELGDLTHSFIAMNEAINQKIQQIEEINASLERKVKERTAALAASEQESRTLIENSPDTIARYDRECRRTYVNPAFGAMAEGGVTALLGKKPSESPGGANAAIYEARINEVFASGQNTQFELKWPGKDGKEFCSHIRLTAERDLSGKVISVLGVGRDITELSESRAELNSKEMAKSRFLAAAGHDLRQPLAAANLFIDALRYTGTSPEQEQIIQRLDQAMSTFNGLLEALLNISRLDAGIIKPELAAINVAEIFNWLEQNFAPIAGEKQLRFRLRFSMRERQFIHSDIGLLESVLINLVSNAIKYTAKGSVLVAARRRGNDMLFQVWDTGMGISQEHVKHIFDEFYQINNPQRDRTRGLGLGLAIARRAMTLLGGEIRCHSREGRGSVFEFRLPLADERQASVPQFDSAPLLENAEQEKFVQGKHFMVVEDDALVAEGLTRSIQALGGKVTRFLSAENALRYAHIPEVDYYIADYMLGNGLNGIQFLKQLRQRLGGKPVKAVLMTGDTSPAFIREAADCDWPVLHKPVSLSKLVLGLWEVR